MSEYIGEYVVSLTPKTFTDLRFHRHEEIVRCRDCTYKRKSWNGKRPDFIPDGFFCAYWGGRELWKPDGFCAWGERRSE